MSVKHVPREANNVAHCLPNATLSQMLDKIWIEECPFFIQDWLYQRYSPFFSTKKKMTNFIITM
jgi:hypothetical protein